ncbi:hypothetical protein SAMN04487895_103298 [Paenibacillus sophorae]|uniref:Uncharacterized protein n=1 Tax=Paenibacillus sophorae TaxID=1333845 RepID=A0A1H8K5M4_9BACL|nr:hypothetical protein SAMN04487895_103298 [Paenibacillus sophorae]
MKGPYSEILITYILFQFNYASSVFRKVPGVRVLSFLKYFAAFVIAFALPFMFLISKPQLMHERIMYLQDQKADIPEL